MAIVSSSSGRKPARRPEALVDPQPAPEEAVTRPEDKLRPQRLDAYIGQSELKQVLGIAVEAALGRGDGSKRQELYVPTTPSSIYRECLRLARAGRRILARGSHPSP